MLRDSSDKCCYLYVNELKGVWGMHSAGDVVMCYGGYGVGQRSLKSRMLLEEELCVSSTLFEREDKMKVTFRRG